MIINFDEIKSNTYPNFCGGNGALTIKAYADNLNKALIGELEPNSEVGYHTHTTNSEFYFILKGTGVVQYDDNEELVKEGSLHYCPKGHSHKLTNTGSEKMTFLAIIPEQ
ncbi:MAG: cupin domain-containing protein [Candidatus Gastranaerophilaceae bacterium]